MRQIRTGVFETNSSSSHSLVIGTTEEYKLFKAGKLVIDVDNQKFIEPIAVDDEDDECTQTLTHEEIDDDNDNVLKYTTKSGDKVVGISFEYAT